VQAGSPAGGRGLLTDLNGDIALAVVSVDTADGPDTGLIERLRGLGLPVLAFGLEGSTASLAKTLERLSWLLSYEPVAAVLKETLCVSGRNRRDRPTHRFHQPLSATGLGFS
jgi:hypothetical protein